LPIRWEISFNEDVGSSFTVADIAPTLGGTLSGPAWMLSHLGGNVWQLELTSIAGTSGTILPNIGSGAVTDLLGNPNASSHVILGVTYHAPPTVTFPGS